MKVKYIQNHDTGKIGEIKEQPDQFANYLIARGKAVRVEIETKELKVTYKTK